ncbi:54S ribosomal protein L8, mitochondrial [Sorochytrium milnesiophthora]
MRHGNALRKLGRDSAHRRSLLRNLVTSLVLYDRITTTVPKAKEAQRLAEKMVTLAKRGDNHARTQAEAFLFQPNVTVPKLFSQVAARYTTRNGGYTRIIRVGSGKYDKSPQAVLEYVDAPGDLKIATAKRNLPNLSKQIEAKRAQLAQSVSPAQDGSSSSMFSQQQMRRMTKTLRGMQRQHMKLSKALDMPFLPAGHHEVKFPLRSQEVHVEKKVSVLPVYDKGTTQHSVDRFGNKRYVTKVKRTVRIEKAFDKTRHKRIGNQHLAI